jgi:hypothetical protein
MEMQVASNHLFDGAEEYVQSTTRHMGDFSDAVQRWRGAASKEALQETVERWETRHAVHRQQVQSVGERIVDVARQFVNADHRASDTVSRIGSA